MKAFFRAGQSLRKHWVGTGIRFRFALVLVILGIPFLAFITLSALEEERAARERLRAESMALARLTSARLDEQVRQVEQLIATVAEVVGTNPQDRERNNAFLRRMRRHLPDYLSDAAVWDLEGKNLGSMDPQLDATPINVSDRDYFRRALKTDRLVLSAPLVSRVNQDYIAEFARQVSAPGAPSSAVLTATVRLVDLERFLDAQMTLPRHALVSVVDESGTILARNLDAQKWIGKSIPDTAKIRETFANQTGSSELRGVDGVLRYGGYSSANSGHWMVYVALPLEDALAPIQTQFYRALVVGTLLLAVAAATSAWFGRRVALPLVALADDARRFAEGDLAHRSTVEGGREIASLAAILNRMAASLEERESQLAHSQAWLQSITDAVPALIGYVDRSAILRFANRHYLELLGLDPRSIVGRSLGDVLGEDAFARVRPNVERALAGQKVRFAYELALNGDRHDLVENYLPDIGAQGEVRGFFVLSLDMTEQNRNSLALRESEERVRTISDNLPALIAYIDHEERYRFLNAYHDTVFKRDRATLMGHTVLETRGPEMYASIRPHIEAALSGRRVSFEGEFEVDGRMLYYRSHFIPDVAPSGEVRGYYAMTLDTTEQRNAQLESAEAAKRLRTITDNLPALVSYLDDEQRFTFANRTYHDWFGAERASPYGMTLQEYYGEPTYALIRPRIERALGGERVTYEREIATLDGTRHVQVTAVPDVDHAGRVQGLFVLMHDITDRKAAEMRQAESEERLRTIADNVPALICTIDRDHVFRFNNRTYEDWLARPLAEVTGRSLLDVYGPEIYEKIRPSLEAALGGRRVEVEFDLPGADGRTRFARGVYVPQSGPDGSTAGVYGLINDVTSIKEAEAKLWQLAQCDALTGLANRYRFNERLAQAIQAPREKAFAVMFLDIDRFKEINDSLGHEGGDDVLKEFGRRLEASVRTTDLVARLAGDEFVVLLESLNAGDEAHFIARKVLHAIEGRFEVRGTFRTVTTSIGVAVHRPDESDAKHLLRRADEALYEAKKAGRNAFRVSA